MRENAGRTNAYKPRLGIRFCGKLQRELGVRDQRAIPVCVRQRLQRKIGRAVIIAVVREIDGFVCQINRLIDKRLFIA